MHGAILKKISCALVHVHVGKGEFPPLLSIAIRYWFGLDDVGFSRWNKGEFAINENEKTFIFIFFAGYYF